MILPLTTGNQRLYNQLTTNVVPNLLLWFTLISFCCESHHFRQLFHQRGLANRNNPSNNVHTLEAKQPGDMIFFHNSIAYGRGHDGRLWVLRSRRGKQQRGEQQSTQFREKTTLQLIGNRGDGPQKRRRRIRGPVKMTFVSLDPKLSSFPFSMYEWILVGENARVDGRTRPGAVDCCLKLFYTHERYI